MSGTLGMLLVVEAVLTILTVVAWIWRGFLDMKEDDHLVLDEAEEHLQREQALIRARVGSLTTFLKVSTVVWVLMALVIGGTWVVTELRLI